VIEGTATVSEDGLSVTSDPGTGITKPGWHGLTPPGNRGRSDIPRKGGGASGSGNPPGPATPSFPPGGTGTGGPNGPGTGGPTGGGNTGGGGTGSSRPGFQIDLRYVDQSLTASQQLVFEQAARRWEQIIVGDLPNVMTDIGLVDDLVIDAFAVAIDGVGTVLGSAGPTVLRSGSSLPARGRMRFDSADIASLESSGQLFSVILHEIGHVLGIGTIWTRLNLLSGAGGADPRFTGANAVAAYNSIFGLSATSVPVANTGSAGNRDGHWRESTFDNELMTGFVESAGIAMPISRITVGSLVDLGYVVNFAAADPYSPPPPPPPPDGPLSIESGEAALEEEPMDPPTEVSPIGFWGDFGTNLSPVTSNRVAVTSDTLYTAALGYGWVLGPGEVVASVDRGASAGTTDLTRDFVTTRRATFVRDLPNGIYDVTISLGDSAESQSQARVYLEGDLRGNVSLRANQFASSTYRVTVVDGQLTMLFDSESLAAINGIDVNLVTDQNFETGGTSELSGRFYFAIENLNNGFVMRGETNLGFGGALCPDGVFLASNTPYRQWVYEVATGKIGVSDFITPESGVSFEMPVIILGPPTGRDLDNDGLDEYVEFIVGTSDTLVDTDHDGISDAAEIAQGLDPLTGRSLTTGVVASMSLQGAATEIALVGSVISGTQQTAYIATGDFGLAVIDASRFLSPILLSQLDLPGFATDVAVDATRNLAVLATGFAGLQIVDVAAATSPTLLQSVPLPGGATRVEIYDGLIYAGSPQSDRLHIIDLATGELLESIT
ncbi:leishmanolysin-related zinc metalloendopeptidase, partial [Stieleria sp.]|uniref:leishmanolysin-related zinc metalloendopeptidase n=1 Tax=Stieleria sp. TaxID=2795976 RepID=UPI0035688359